MLFISVSAVLIISVHSDELVRREENKQFL